MNHQHPVRRIPTVGGGGASRLMKRKKIEPLFPARPPPTPAPEPEPVPANGVKGAKQETQPSNQILAGYMAYEFLTKGTLLGQKYDPARAEAVPLSPAHSSKRVKTVGSGKIEAEPKPKPRSQSYSELASLLKSEVGAHLPGIVNPTQLARWIQM